MSQKPEQPPDRKEQERRTTHKQVGIYRGVPVPEDPPPLTIPARRGTPLRPGQRFDILTQQWLEMVDHRPTSQEQADAIDQSLVRRVRYTTL